MKILYFHIPNLKRYMLPTKRFIGYIKNKFDVIDCITVSNQDDAMGFYLKKYWGTEDLIIIGQDNLPTVAMIKELRDCKSDLCVNPCIQYPVSTDKDRPLLNQIDKDGNMYEVDDQPKWIYYCGTGVCKISKKAQLDHSVIKGMSFGYPYFDSTLFQVGLRNWHGHYPLHKHLKDLMEYRL